VSRSPTQRAAFREGLAVGGAVGLYGASFGAVSTSAGLDVWQTCVLSLLMFTGASQFAFVGVVAGGGTITSAAVTALLLGLRNTLYGLRLASLLRFRGPRRLAAAHLVIDESTAMAIGRPDRGAARTGFLVTGLVIFLGWNLFTLLGAVGGTLIGDPRAYGLDAAVGAAFLALLWPRLHGVVHRVTALGAVALALGLVPLTAPGVPVLAAAVVAIGSALLVRTAAVGAVDPAPDEPVGELP
jgi:predicted branched-subunit amino acid permease